MTAPPGDIGYWTGSITYDPPDESTTVLSPASVPLGATDSNGVWWLLQKVEGWDSPDVQGGGVLPKSGDHGAWPAPQYYAPRALTLTVMAIAPSQAMRDLARAQLQQAVPISDLAVFQYNEPVPKQAMVRRSGKITETYQTLGDVTFSVAMIAPDPRKYGTQLNAVTINALPTDFTGFTSPFTSPWAAPSQLPAGAVQVTNAGTFETRPVITVKGPITSPVLANVTTGQQISFTGLVVPAGSQLVCDFNIAQATLDGVYRPADLMSSWWTLPPGTSTFQLSGQSLAGSSAEIAWRHAWI